MVKHLCVDFCFYPQQYEESRRLWLDAIAGVESDQGLRPRLSDLPDAPLAANVLIPHCGDPIVAVVDEETGRELHISQRPPMRSRLELQAYTDTSQRNALALYINCALSEESLETALKLVEPWFIRQLSEEGMSAIIDQEIGWLYE